MVQLREDQNTTFIPIATEQTPLPFSIMGVADDNPANKHLVAMFKSERHRDLILDILNGEDPLYWDVNAYPPEEDKPHGAVNIPKDAPYDPKDY